MVLKGSARSLANLCWTLLWDHTLRKQSNTECNCQVTRGQPVGTSPLLPPRGLQGLNSGSRLAGKCCYLPNHLFSPQVLLWNMLGIFAESFLTYKIYWNNNSHNKHLFIRLQHAFFNIYLCLWMLYLHLCMWTMCVPSALRGQKGVSGPLEPHGHCELDPGPLQGFQIVSAAKPPCSSQLSLLLHGEIT